MSSTDQQGTRTEAVAIFEDAETFQAAIDEILSSGFDRAELNLLASEHAVKEKLGHMYEKATELEDDPSVPHTAYVSTRRSATPKAPSSVGCSTWGP
jgi:hypothetical protein